MAVERLGVVADADGKPFYVVERDAIGAEHINAQAKWTRSHNAVATLQHDEDGRHNTRRIPRAFVYMHFGDNNCQFDPLTRVFGVTYREDPTIIQAALTGFRTGEAILTLSRDLPNMNYSVRGYSGRSAPGSFGSGGITTSLGNWRVYVATRTSLTEFEVRIDDGVSTRGVNRVGWAAFALEA